MHTRYGPGKSATNSEQRRICRLPRRAEAAIAHRPDFDPPLVRLLTVPQLIEELVDFAKTHPAYDASRPLVRTTKADKFKTRVRDRSDSDGPGSCETCGDKKIGVHMEKVMRDEIPVATERDYTVAAEALRSNKFFHAILYRKGIADLLYHKAAANALEITFHHLAIVDHNAAHALAIELFQPAVVHIMKPRARLQSRQPLLTRDPHNADEERPSKRTKYEGVPEKENA